MSIEKRAHQYGCKAAGGWYKGGMRGAVYEAHCEAYIEIATEQHQIDINRLKEILNVLMIDTRDKAAIIKAIEEDV